MLTKRLTAVGNSVGLILDKTLLDLLDLHEGAEVQLQIETGKLIISPVPSSPTRDSATNRGKILAAHKRVLKKHAGTLRKLAK